MLYFLLDRLSVYWCCELPCVWFVCLCVQCGWSALHIAAWNGYSDLCSVLLKSGVDPDLGGGTSETVSALCLASQQGHIEVCRQLIEAGCNVSQSVDIDDCECVTALHMAARNGHSDVVRLLVSAKVDIEAGMTTRLGVSGVTALHLAVESGHLDIIDVLLDEGSNVNTGTTSVTESVCWISRINISSQGHKFHPVSWGKSIGWCVKDTVLRRPRHRVGRGWGDSVHCSPLGQLTWAAYLASLLTCCNRGAKNR